MAGSALQGAQSRTGTVTPRWTSGRATAAAHRLRTLPHQSLCVSSSLQLARASGSGDTEVPPGHRTAPYALRGGLNRPCSFTQGHLLHRPWSGVVHWPLEIHFLVRIEACKVPGGRVVTWAAGCEGLSGAYAHVQHRREWLGDNEERPRGAGPRGTGTSLCLLWGQSPASHLPSPGTQISSPG